MTAQGTLAGIAPPPRKEAAAVVSVYEHGVTHDSPCGECGSDAGMRCVRPDGQVACRECALAWWRGQAALTEQIVKGDRPHPLAGAE